MQIKETTKDAIYRLSKTPDGKELIVFLKELVNHTGDVRRITQVTEADVKGRQLACAIIEDEIISRFTSSSSKTDIIKEQYE